MRRLALLSTLLLSLAACGVGDGADADAGALPPVPADQQDDAPLASACLEGEPDCEDIGDPNADPLPLPEPGDEPIAVPDGMTVTDVLAADSIDGPFVVEGFLVVSADGQAALCSALAESYPPQCGGHRLPITGEIPGLDEYQSDQGVTWSDFPILLEGTYDGTTFTVAS